MQKFRLLNDIHLESGDMVLQPSDDDKETILLLAGDIYPITVNPKYSGKQKRLETFMRACVKQFQEVIVVLGNHDYYHNDLYDALYRWKGMAKAEGFIVLENETIVRDNVAIIGATLWTDYKGADPVLMANAKFQMYDHTAIKHNGKSLTTEHCYDRHVDSKQFIFSEIYDRKDSGMKVLVMTHHAPSWLSVTPRFIGDSLNGCFVSGLDEDILDSKPDVWCHGHVHSQHDYMIGDCRVICNSRGYTGFEEYVGDFKEKLVFEL